MRSASVVPLDQLHHQEVPAGGVLETVERGDVGMIQRGEGLRLTLELHRPIGIGHEGLEHHLECYVSIEPRVARAIDLAHSALAQRVEDVKRTDGAANHDGECS